MKYTSFIEQCEIETNEYQSTQTSSSELLAPTEKTDTVQTFDITPPPATGGQKSRERSDKSFKPFRGKRRRHFFSGMKRPNKKKRTHFTINVVACLLRKWFSSKIKRSPVLFPYRYTFGLYGQTRTDYHQVKRVNWNRGGHSEECLHEGEKKMFQLDGESWFSSYRQCERRKAETLWRAVIQSDAFQTALYMRLGVSRSGWNQISNDITSRLWSFYNFTLADDDFFPQRRRNVMQRTALCPPAAAAGAIIGANKQKSNVRRGETRTQNKRQRLFDLSMMNDVQANLAVD